MKKKIIYSIVSVLGLSLLFAGVASAHGFFMKNISPEEITSRQKEMFEHQAEILGVSVDTVKNGWAQGKTIWEIAQENGITKEQLQEKMKQEREEQMKSHLQALVDQGVITQAQADQRLQFMKTKTNSDKKMSRRFNHGFWF